MEPAGLPRPAVTLIENVSRALRMLLAKISYSAIVTKVEIRQYLLMRPSNSQCLSHIRSIIWIVYDEKVPSAKDHSLTCYSE